MKAAVFVKEGLLELKEVPEPQITRDDQVVIEVLACSICGTDVHITRTPPGYTATPNTILGHEFCGRIVKKGPQVQHLEIGDTVVVNPNNYCGNCYYCRENLPNLCEHIEALGIDYDGAFAKYCCVSGQVAYRISPDVPAGVAACAEPLACAVNGLNKVNIRPADSVVIIGAGPIGLMLAMLAQKSGANRLYILETAPYRVEFARKLGLGRVINPKEEDAGAILLADTTVGADFAFDVTGSQIVSAVTLVRKGGSVVLFGVNKASVSSVAQCEITTKEIAVLGTWLANATFPQAVRMLENNAIDMAQVITDTILLDDIHKGLDKLRSGQAEKIIVVP